MFYAEIYGDTGAGEPYIKQRGVFWNIAELAFYRARGAQDTVRVLKIEGCHQSAARLQSALAALEAGK